MTKQRLFYMFKLLYVIFPNCSTISGLPRRKRLAMTEENCYAKSAAIQKNTKADRT
jgi:hypothetical protein